MTKEQAARGAAVLGVFGLAILASALAGTPDELPDVALEWCPLFHILRASALLGAVGVVLLIGWRATKGEFPIKFGNIEYAKEAAAEAQKVSTAQERRLQYLEVLAGLRDPEDLDLEDDQEES
jgi:hypothetical protein